jgi:putative ABC transport system permease protein
MLENYFKTAFRNILRYKGFSLINIASLAIGATGCLIIGLFVWDELRFDRFIPGGENVYRVYNKRSDNISTSSLAVVPPMFATYAKQHYPEVESTMRIIMESGKKLWEVGDLRSYEEKGLLTEASFFDIFPLKLIKGDYKYVLDQPDAVVLTEDMATKYFGRQEAIGKIVRIDKSNYTVKAIIENAPEHFHLNFNYLLSFSSLHLPGERMNSWRWQQFYTYFKLKPSTRVQQFETKFQAGVKKEAVEITRESGFTYLPYLQQLKDIHLQSASFEYDNARRGNETYVNALITIAIFVLVIACFNFINLSTARSFRRAKEIGVRKVAGADRRQLVFQFTAETMFFSMIAVLIAAIATRMLLPALNNFTGKSISFDPFVHPILVLLLIAGALLVGVLAGIYPAMVLSGFQPIRVLKGIKPTGDNGSRWLRQGLVVIQFALSVLLIVSTTIVYRQINFLHNKDLGFNKEQVLLVPIQGAVGNNWRPLKTS